MYAEETMIMMIGPLKPYADIQNTQESNVLDPRKREKEQTSPKLDIKCFGSRLHKSRSYMTEFQ